MEPEEDSPSDASGGDTTDDDAVTGVDDEPEIRSMAPVLWLALLTLVLTPFLSNQPAGRVVITILISLTALSALRLSGVAPKQRHVAQGLVIAVAVLGSISREAAPQELTTVSLGLFTALLLVTPAVVVKRLMLRPRITVDTVAGALAAYIQIGLAFASLFQFQQQAMGEPFFVQISDATPMNFQFFSFVTLTTLGYGDLTPATNVGQTSAIMEAILGQLFLVTVVAMAVSNIGRVMPHRAGATRDGSAGTDQAPR